jgi:hypothetical protein
MLPPEIARCDGYVPFGADDMLAICADCRRREPGADDLTTFLMPPILINPLDGSRICAQRIAPKG